MKKLYIIFAVIGLLAVGYVYASQRGLLSPNTSGIPTEINTLQGNIGEQFSVLSSRAQELGGHVQNVLGNSVQVDKQSEQSLQQKAIDYGQYLYCKQVVESYEAKQ